jgi:hypothetical protein
MDLFLWRRITYLAVIYRRYISNLWTCLFNW